MTLALVAQKICEKNNLKFYVHSCSFCGYKCGYIFNSNQIFYDSGCDCFKNKNYIIELRTFDEFSRHISSLKKEEQENLARFLLSPESVIQTEGSLTNSSFHNGLLNVSKDSPLEMRV